MLQMHLLNTELWLFPNRLGDNYSLMPVDIPGILTTSYHNVVRIVIIVQLESVMVRSIDKCGMQWSDDIKCLWMAKTIIVIWKVTMYESTLITVHAYETIQTLWQV